MKLDAHIPAPPAKNGGRPARYPFATMQVGQSFAQVPRRGETPDDCAKRVRGAAATWRSRNLAQVGFRVRVVVENDRRIVRCWMVEP